MRSFTILRNINHMGVVYSPGDEVALSQSGANLDDLHGHGLIDIPRGKAIDPTDAKADRLKALRAMPPEQVKELSDPIGHEYKNKPAAIDAVMAYEYPDA